MVADIAIPKAICINGSNYANIPGKEDMIHQILSDTTQFWDDIHTAQPIPNATFME